MQQTDLQKNIKKLKTSCGNSDDLIVKEFSVADLSCAICYIRGLASTEHISENILYPASLVKSLPQEGVIQYLMKEAFFFPDLASQTGMKKWLETILHGDAIILVEGQKEAIKASVNSFKERSITEPPTSAVLKGPREGFIENLKTNIVMLRRIISGKSLKTEYLQVGNLSQTQVCVAYLDDIAPKETVKKIIKRIKEINIDGIIDSFYIAQFLEEHPHSMFKQVGTAEKPDIVAGKILEGRIAIFVDGSPIILTLPFIFMEDIQNSDDYYSQHSRATFLRVLRIISMMITLLLPGLYISIQLYHYKAIPLKFIVTIMNSMQGLPLTPFAEILFVLVLFEILY